LELLIPVLDDPQGVVDENFLAAVVILRSYEEMSSKLDVLYTLTKIIMLTLTQILMRNVICLEPQGYSTPSPTLHHLVVSAKLQAGFVSDKTSTCL
jgi:hypothetical protein